MDYLVGPNLFFSLKKFFLNLFLAASGLSCGMRDLRRARGLLSS